MFFLFDGVVVGFFGVLSLVFDARDVFLCVERF